MIIDASGRRSDSPGSAAVQVPAPTNREAGRAAMKEAAAEILVL